MARSRLLRAKESGQRDHEVKNGKKLTYFRRLIRATNGHAYWPHLLMHIRMPSGVCTVHAQGRLRIMNRASLPAVKMLKMAKT